jgi:LCP family protein required for cell wall assembly
MRRHQRSRRRRTFRRWPRRVLITANVVVALCLVSSGGVYAYVHTKIDAIRAVSAPHLTPVGTGTQDSADGLPVENILLIGNQSRAGLTNPAFGSPTELSGTLSDVIMILHVDPAKQKVTLLSIPRDLFVPQPAGSQVGPFQKIDAALNDGANGPDNLIAAITQDWGIPINHFVELNFSGFQATVDALGGIKMDFPDRLYDAESDLIIGSTGCQLLNGAAALALVRARHLQYDPPGVNPDDHSAWPYDPESDLSRIVRDHTFLRVLVSTAKSKGLTNPITANNFIDGIINQITIDPGLRSQIVALIGRFRNIDPATAPETTLPVNQVGGSDGYTYNGYGMGDIEFPNQPLDNQTIAAWDKGALPAASKPVAVTVEDDLGSQDIAQGVANGLSADGLPVGPVADGSVKASPSPTWIDYAPGDQAAGEAVLADVAGAAMLRPDPSLGAGQVKVELGSAASVTGPGAALAYGAPSSTSTSTGSSSGTSSGSSPSTTSGSTTSTTAPGQESTSSGSGSLDPTPSPSSDQVQPWDPRPC